MKRREFIKTTAVAGAALGEPGQQEAPQTVGRVVVHEDPEGFEAADVQQVARGEQDGVLVVLGEEDIDLRRDGLLELRDLVLEEVPKVAGA